MDIEDVSDPNERKYTATDKGRYLSTRMLTHSGTTIAFALRQNKERKTLSIDYSILNAEDQEPTLKPKQSEIVELLDSQSWFENVKTLRFPSEIRVVGEEAIPVIEIPAMDRTGRSLPTNSREDTEKLDLWLSTSICIMDPTVTDFEVFSDGKYIYLFRQSLASSDPLAKRIIDLGGYGSAFFDSNLLCDRFTLVGSTLSRTLEVRYRRSRQKRLPLNEKDTLAVRDINDMPFYEPTFSLRFICNMVGGRFTVLQTPTSTNGVFRWMMFAFSSRTNHIECFTMDVASDGLFDLHGQVYYTCDSKKHLNQKVFSNSPGSCSATDAKSGAPCGNTKTPIVPAPLLSERALLLSEDNSSPELRLRKPIDLSSSQFARGFTIEAWIGPSSFWVTPSVTPDTSEEESDGQEKAANGSAIVPKPSKKPVETSLLPPADTTLCIFFIASKDPSRETSLSVYLDDHLRPVLQLEGSEPTHIVSDIGLEADVFSHISLTYSLIDTAKRFEMTVNGKLCLSKSLSSSGPGYAGLLSTIIPRRNDDDNGGDGESFQGYLDELRLWSLPLDPATIKGKMSRRATGMEPYLEACWHFDEGTGIEAFDSTGNGHHIDIDLLDSRIIPENLWMASTADVMNNYGLTQRTLRLSADVIVAGGLGASVYYEQVSLSKDSKPTSSEGGQNDAPKNKPMKRTARLLLCFVARETSGTACYLAVVDFGILSEGTLCDWPAVLEIPKIAIADVEETPKKSAATALLYVDAQGVETLGGFLAFDAAQCTVDPPCVWDSSTGTINIYFRNTASIFSALTYDISRSILASEVSSLSGHSTILAACKLRQARKVTIQTKKWPLTPPNVAIQLIVKAQMEDGKEISERWRGIPANIKTFCDLLNGINNLPKNYLSELLDLEDHIEIYGKQKFQAYRLVLAKPLRYVVPAATCVKLGSRYLQVLRDAMPSDEEIIVSREYLSSASRPSPGTPIYSWGYDHTNLVKCEEKPTGNFSQGSSVISILPISLLDDQAASMNGQTCVDVDKESLISVHGQTPVFTSPLTSSALQLSSDKVYTMLEEAVTTASSPGIAFESWIKVDSVAEHVIVAYNSQRLPRSEGGDLEYQTFVLGVANSPSQEEYALAGNANGTLFSIRKARAFQKSRWAHVACSLHNTFALRFSGLNYVDLGNAAEWNVNDFTLIFTLQLDEIGREQTLLTKAGAYNSACPLQVKVSSLGRLILSYWAEDENGGNLRQRSVSSPETSPLARGDAYKVFISRSWVQVRKSNTEAPRPYQLVTMRVWRSDDTMLINMVPPTKAALESNVNIPLDGSAQICGAASGNDAPMTIGGAAWASGQGITGIVGPIRLFSAAITLPGSAKALPTSNSERSLIGSWSFSGTETLVLTDDTGRNDGKLKNEPQWVHSPFKQDHRLSIFVNGVRVNPEPIVGTVPVMLRNPVGPHQLTLGNSMHGDQTTRYFAMQNSFQGELDELRIWNVPRTRENVCDTMNTRLSEVPQELAVYLPFDESMNNATTSTSAAEDHGLLLDASVNCWHMSPVYGFPPSKTVSQAPVGHDASCVRTALSETETGQNDRAAKITGRPSVAEYGDLQIGASGGMEGSYKRAYSSIDSEGQWVLNTGFRIGSLLTEWVSQVQTSPTLIGYIEGAPPVPIENFVREGAGKPSTAIRFQNATRTIYQYGLRSETGTDLDISSSQGLGGKWQVSGGIGIEAETSAGEIKGALKRKLDINSAQFKNNTTTMTNNVNMEMRMELSGDWAADVYKASNTGLALVESEVADVFALRLKMRGGVAPLIAYQMRPNPDIPKDRNLVSFEINKSYTKQGCLDGRNGLKNDEDYPPTSEAPKDASYYKPIEAYALKDRIRRAQEQLEGEYERYQLNAKDGKKELPKRTSRNICNSYVWTADGGTFQESHSNIDFVQTEVGGNNNKSTAIGGSFDMEISIAGFLTTANFDALYATHTNLMQTKEKSSEKSFELQAELPNAIEIRHEDDNKKWVKRPGAVDAYRWMSFWLEPTTEGTDVFFQRVVDPQWLEQSSEPNAKLLLELRESLKKEVGNAKTKAWRVLHRVTYVSRVLEKIPRGKPTAVPASAEQNEKKKGLLLAEISSNWLILQRLAPLVQSAKTRTEVARLAERHIAKMYPSIRAQPRFYSQILDLLADYLGVD